MSAERPPLARVTFNMLHDEDPFHVLVAAGEYLAQHHMMCEDNAESLVNEIAEWIASDSEFWDEEFGETSTYEDVAIEVLSPEEIAGFYNVTLERVVRAHARKGVDPRPVKSGGTVMALHLTSCERAAPTPGPYLTTGAIIHALNVSAAAWVMREALRAARFYVEGALEDAAMSQPELDATGRSDGARIEDAKTIAEMEWTLAQIDAALASAGAT